MAQLIGFKPKPKPKPKLGIIVQARMTSTRFPGKMTAMLLDKPVIEWVLERVSLVRGPKSMEPIRVVIAVPDDDASEPILEIADRLGISNFMGSEHNVLERYYESAVFFGFDYIMRVTGDCPFIDPVVCSQVFQLLTWRKLDYTSNIFPKRTYAKGLDCEAFTFDCLEAAYKLAEDDYDKEHVTPWMQRSEIIQRGLVQQQINNSEKNWCVDVPEDIARLEAEIARVGKPEFLLGAAKNDNDTTD
jgi:spore coat polysaccharide biosynthesis protein SpsF (cytidylyltransferase family)